MNSSPSRPHFFGLLAGLFLAAGLIGAAMVLTHAWLQIAESQVVSVTGSARKAVQSDLVVWRGSFSVEAKTLPEAQSKLKTDFASVLAVVKAVVATNFSLSTISIQEVRALERGEDRSSAQRTIAYRLGQSVEVQTGDVAVVDRLDTASASLVEQGVAFVVSSPEYIYTRAGEAKVEMLAEATRDARARAEQIASQGGRGIDQLRAAKMGVFQITPRHSVRTSWEGINDTTTLDKTITAVVTASFSLK